MLHNIIAHIILPRKGHLDEITHFNLFLLDSFLVGQRLDFPTIVIGHMKIIHSSTRVKTLPYDMLLTKILKHFEIPFNDEVFISLRPTDVINIHTLKRMKIVKERGQWVARTKGFDPDSGPSTLPFEGDDEEDEEAGHGHDEDIPLPPTPPHDFPGSRAPQTSDSFTFTEDHYNFLNRRIESLTSSINGLGGMLYQLQVQQNAIQAQQTVMHAQQDAFYAHYNVQ